MRKMRLLVVLPDEKQMAEARAAQTPGQPIPTDDVLRERLTIKYKALVQTALRTPQDPRGGVTIEEMERSLNILKIVDEVNDGGVLELEDADHQYLIEKLGAVRWTGFDQRIVTFVHAVKNATKDLLDGVPETNHAEPLALVGKTRRR